MASVVLLVVLIASASVGLAGCASFPVATNFHVLHTIHVSAVPHNLAVSPGGKQLYVSTLESKLLNIIEISSRNIERPINVGVEASFIVFSRDGRYSFVGSVDRERPSYRSILKIDTLSRAVVGEIQMEHNFVSIGAVLSPDSKWLYVTSTNGTTLAVIDAIDFQIARKIHLGEGGSFGLVISPDGSRLYVAHAFKGSVTLIETRTNTVIRVIESVGMRPVAMAASTDGKRLYVVDNGDPSIKIIDTEVLSVVGRIQIGPTFFHKFATGRSFSPKANVYLNKDQKLLIVWTPYLPYLAVVDLEIQETKSVIPMDKEISGMAGSGRLLFLSHAQENTVTVIAREDRP